MDLPDSLSYVETMGSGGDLTTVKALEGGLPVVVQTPSDDPGISAFLGAEAMDGAETYFLAAKGREGEAAKQSKYFLEGRLAQGEGRYYWVRPFIDRSLRDLVAFKECPKPSELARICIEIASGLADLQTFDGGAHGNLSLSNVLLSPGEGTAVRLVDPKPSSVSVAAGDDRRALGLILYQLINGEFVELDDGLTSVPEDQEWKRLGRAGDRWKEICDDLLNPKGRFQAVPWSEIRREFGTLAVVSTGRTKFAIFGLVALIAAGGVWILFKWSSEGEEVVVDPATIQGQWLELLGHYFDWGAVFLRSRNDFRPAETDRNFVNRFYEEDRAVQAFQVIAEVTGSGRRLVDRPESVRGEAEAINVRLLDSRVQQRIVVAHEYFSDLHARIENWDVLQRLEKSRERFESIGFDYGFQEVNRLLSETSFADGSLTLNWLYQLRTQADRMGELQTRYEEFESSIRRLRGYDSVRFPVLFATYLEDELRVGGAVPSEHLRMLADAAGAFTSFWESKRGTLMLSELVAGEPVFLERFGPIVDFTAADKWQDWAMGYSVIDPKILGDARKELVKFSQEVASFDERINELQEPDTPTVNFSVEAHALISSFDEATDLPPIELNRGQILEAVKVYSQRMEAVKVRASAKWSEINPDIGVQLIQLAGETGRLDGVLKEVWRSHLDREVVPLTEASFDEPRQFIRFIREERDRLRRLEHFQDNYFNALASEAGPSLRSGGGIWYSEAKAVFEELRDRGLQDWALRIGKALIDGSLDPAGLEASVSEQRSKLSGSASRVASYFSEIEAAAGALNSWQLPDPEFDDRLNAAATKIEGSGWSERPVVARWLLSVENARAVWKLADGALLVRQARNTESADFHKFLALLRLSGLPALDPAVVLELAAVVAELDPRVPEIRLDDWKEVRKTIWINTFGSKSFARSARVALIDVHVDFGVDPGSLSGEPGLLWEAWHALNDLRTNELRYAAQPEMLKEVIDGLVRRAAGLESSEVGAMLLNLKAVDLTRTEATFDDLECLKQGWVIEEQSDERLVLAWRGHRLPLLRLESDSGDFYLAEIECSIGLFSQWMVENNLWNSFSGELPREWGTFLNARYNPLDDYREGLRLWDIDRRGLVSGGIVPSVPNFTVDPTTVDEYRSSIAGIRGSTAVSQNLPVQHLGARLARSLALSMGMDLPTPEQWRTAVLASDQSSGNLWQDTFYERLSDDLVRELRIGSFYHEFGVAGSGSVAMREALMEEVQGEPGRLSHLSGNVAEFLWSPDEERFFVAGGSVLSAAADDWERIHILPPSQERRAFSDVGFRFAIDAPDKSAFDSVSGIIEQFCR